MNRWEKLAAGVAITFGLAAYALFVIRMLQATS